MSTTTHTPTLNRLHEALLTSLSVIEIDKLLPLVMRQDAQDGIPQFWSHLDDKLHVAICGVARCYKGGVEGPTEGG